MLSGGLTGPDAVVDLLMDGAADDPAAPRAQLRVREWDPPHRLVVDWAHTGQVASRLEIGLRDEGARTRLVLEHGGLESGQEYLDGWHAHLDLLVALAEARARPPWAEAHSVAQALGS